VISVRLPEGLEHEVDQLAKAENKTRTEIVKEALQSYLQGRRVRLTPYQLGVDLFSVGSGGSEDLSQTYKARLKEKLSEKHSH